MADTGRAPVQCGGAGDENALLFPLLDPLPVCVRVEWNGKGVTPLKRSKAYELSS